MQVVGDAGMQNMQSWSSASSQNSGEQRAQRWEGLDQEQSTRGSRDTEKLSSSTHVERGPEKGPQNLGANVK